MEGKVRIFGIVVVVFAVILAIVFASGLAGLGYRAFFAPKQAAIDRQVFEETQSYVLGKIQDLAKYKREYNAATKEIERKAIQAVINQQFAQFDKNKIQDEDLRRFLVEMRGF